MQGQLRRSNDKMLAGVCGGIAEYFNIDPVIVRLVFVLATLFMGFPVIIYPILWLVMPEAYRSTPPQVVHMVPDHPRPVEQWHYDPVTGERIQR
ncbi:PspC domain-containing protein [Chloroflexia bacterium SDU3-3]|nr:PspC domain-containing protein [Chloroflexia bacterium SDU3-3]